MADHEGHLGGGEVLGGDDEVAFVFAGDGVEDNDGLAGGEGGYGGGDGVEGWVGWGYCRLRHVRCLDKVDGMGEFD